MYKRQMFVIISTAVALPLGITAAIHQNGWQDRVCMVVAMVCTSVPDFWLALMMVYLFSLKLGWLPSFGIEQWQCYIMPVIAGSLHGIGQLARQTRSSMLDVCRADFVTTARAKGLPEKRVIYSHMLPNALIPVITIIGGSFGRSIAGTIIIEQVFSMPEMCIRDSCWHSGCHNCQRRNCGLMKRRLSCYRTGQ